MNRGNDFDAHFTDDERLPQEIRDMMDDNTVNHIPLRCCGIFVTLSIELCNAKEIMSSLSMENMVFCHLQYRIKKFGLGKFFLFFYLIIKTVKP